MKHNGFDVEAAVRAKTTKEMGLRFVDASNVSWAEFPVEDGTAFTGEIEIMRGDLANILYDSVKNMTGLEVIFGRSISSIEETKTGIISVRLDRGWTDHGEARAFDFVVAADGLASIVRTLVFKDESSDAIKSLNQWSCWFSIPWKDTDSLWARWYNGTKGRMVLIRPDNEELTRVSLWTMSRDPAVEKTIREVRKASTLEQKKFWFEHFQSIGWEGDRVLADMLEADDFYMQEIAQVKLDRFSKGSVGLVGDACYCPSPISGMGTTTALVGAYVLAGEVITQPEDIPAALKAYEDKMRPFTTVAQQLAPGTPGLANPETAWGIWALYWFLSLVAWSKVYKLFTASFNPPARAMDFPSYNI